MTPEQLKQDIINSLRQSPYQKVIDFANNVGDKCWADLAQEFYNQQNFSLEEKQDIFNRLLAFDNDLIKKIIIIFAEKEDSFVLERILSSADSKLKRFLARYADSDNIRQALLSQNPDKELLKDIIAGMINKKLVEQYKNSSDIELRQAYYTRIQKDNLTRRLWR